MIERGTPKSQSTTGNMASSPNLECRAPQAQTNNPQLRNGRRSHWFRHFEAQATRRDPTCLSAARQPPVLSRLQSRSGNRLRRPDGECVKCQLAVEPWVERAFAIVRQWMALAGIAEQVGGEGREAPARHHTERQASALPSRGRLRCRNRLSAYDGATGLCLDRLPGSRT
jgi:hypothetical protein